MSTTAIESNHKYNYNVELTHPQHFTFTKPHSFPHKIELPSVEKYHLFQMIPLTVAILAFTPVALGFGLFAHNFTIRVLSRDHFIGQPVVTDKKTVNAICHRIGFYAVVYAVTTLFYNLFL